MTRYNKEIYATLIFLFLLTSVSAAVDTVKLYYDANDNGVWDSSTEGYDYDYAIIGRPYFLEVLGPDLQPADNTLELTLSEIVSPNWIKYNFNPNSTIGTRTFGSVSNQFQISVISEADELVDSIGSVVIEIKDYSSSVQINDLDLSNRVINNLDLSKIANPSQVPELNGISGNLEINPLLNGVTFNLGFVKGLSHPTYNELQITSSKLIAIVENIFVITGISSSTCSVDEINKENLAAYECLNDVIDFYNTNVTYTKNATAIKRGNDFFFSTDEGYANLNGANLSNNPINLTINKEDILNNIYSLIDENIKYVTPDQILEALLPLGNFSNFTEFVDFHKVGIDYSGLEVQDGEYTLKVLYEDKYGNQVEMPFTIKLDITNEATPETENNHIVTFSDTIIKQTLERVEGLPSGISLTAVLYGSNTHGFLTAPSNIHSLNYIDISSSDQSITGSFDLYFKIARILIPSSAKNDVRLYVREGSSWIQLPTTLINETTTDYKYRATIPHFSNFLIGYVVQSSGGNSKSIFEQPVGQGVANNTNNTGANPINLGNTPTAPTTGFFAGITGAVIGALGSPTGIVSIIFIVVLVGLMVVLKVGRKGKKEKKEKLNDRGDEVDEA